MLLYWKSAKFVIFWNSLLKYKLSLFCRKLAEFMSNSQNMNFFRFWFFFKNDWYIHMFFTNMLLFRWKSAKFTSNCQNINFLRYWFFFLTVIFIFFINTLLFHWKLAKLEAIAKYKFASWLICFKIVQFFFFTKISYFIEYW